MANHIESVSCSVQTIDSLFPSISDTSAISKAITRLSRQSHLTHLEPESSVLGTVTKPDESSDLVRATGPLGDQLNLKCMTKQDWVEGQSKDKTKKLVKSFNCLKQRSCTVEKLMKLTTMR